MNKKIIAALTICAVLALGVIAAFYMLGQSKTQEIDYRDWELTDSQKQSIQNVANEAGKPTSNVIELLSFETKYTKDEDGNNTGLVVVGLLRNGYASDIELVNLNLTVKTSDGDKEIASAYFDGDYGTIKSGQSIVWKFTFTEDFITDKNADLTKTVNYIEYEYNKK